MGYREKWRGKHSPCTHSDAKHSIKREIYTIGLWGPPKVGQYINGEALESLRILQSKDDRYSYIGSK